MMGRETYGPKVRRGQRPAPNGGPKVRRGQRPAPNEENAVCAVQGINAGLATGFQSADLRMLSYSGSILNGPASICTFTRYSAAGSEGTRHEYWQVKPHPYSKLPLATTLPS